MMGTSLRTCAAISAAGAAMVGALAVTLAPTAPADDTWGAISRNTDTNRWAMSYAQPDRSTAITVASKACGKGCDARIMGGPFPACMALAQGTGNNGRLMYAAGGTTQAEAESAALSQNPPDNPHIVASACNQGRSPGVDSGG